VNAGPGESPTSSLWLFGPPGLWFVRMARRSARKTAGVGPPRRAKPAAEPPPSRWPPRFVLAIAASVIVVGGVAGTLLLSLGGGSHHRAAVSGVKGIRWSSVAHLQETPPPWPSESGLLPQRLRPSGLDALTMEGTALHHHEHLDLYVNGRSVVVPALVGIDQQAGFLTELHTHDASGIIHVESPVQRSFTLGQFFCEWGVKLSATCLGPYRGTLSWWVNGVRRHGNPAQLTLRQHQEIVIAAGSPPTRVPGSFNFPTGL
jgi:hypothetical protein